MPSRANLLALYRPLKGNPSTPASELMLMMWPPPCRRMIGSSARQTRRTPKKLGFGFGDGRILDRAPVGIAGVVHHAVNTARLLNELVDALHDGLIAVDIHRNHLYPLAIGCRGHAPLGTEHAVAAGQQMLGARFTDAR